MSYILLYPFHPGHPRFRQCSISVTVFIHRSNNSLGGMSKLHTVGCVQCNESIIQPGSIVEFSYITTKPSDEFLKEAQESYDFEGKRQRTVDIVVFIQFAYPNGEVFSNQFKAGLYSLSNNLKSETIFGINHDLLKSALPVRNNEIESLYFCKIDLKKSES
ncbi:MAG: hypothetical protein BWY95_02197 [Bacteroidetes bacterium ADurb.BinA104]|nr:MAG: hypothetical protein BWY95_02197 [Bacteroidetes bacterium ADurb.BinA104]